MGVVRRTTRIEKYYGVCDYCYGRGSTIKKSEATFSEEKAVCPFCGGTGKRVINEKEEIVTEENAV